MKLLIIIENFPNKHTRAEKLLKGNIEEMLSVRLQRTIYDDITFVFHTINLPINKDPKEMTFIIIGILEKKEIEIIGKILTSVGKNFFKYTNLKVFACEGNMIAEDITG